MKISLGDESNKKIVGIFPCVIEEIKNNIRELTNQNESTVAPDTEMKKIISANKKYINTMRQILPLCEQALLTMQEYHEAVIDSCPMIFVFKGVISYASNRFKELERVRKSIKGEKFFFYDGGSTIVSDWAGRDDVAEDLSYIYSNLYPDFKSLDVDIREADKRFIDASNWLAAVAKSPEYGGLSESARRSLTDLAKNGIFANHCSEIMTEVTKSLKTKEDFKISQGLIGNYNVFLKRICADCWAFQVENNL